MPVLNWIGKESVVNHDKEVPFRLLKKVKSSSLGENSQNLVIHGDNLEALKALMPYYCGKIDVIYIDPPYNTGAEDWIYNDNVNSPKIKNWLGKIVGGETEDLCRHDKWLCMMYPRLKLLKELLADQAVIFISIDENELSDLLLICDEIFQKNNHCGTFVWQKKYGGGNDSGKIATEHEYVVCYSKIKQTDEWLEPHTEKYLKRYKEEDSVGRFFWDTLERPGLRNPIEIEIKYKEKIYTLQTFRSQKRVDEELKTGEIRIVEINNRLSFQFKQRLREGKKPRSILQDRKELIEEGFVKIGSNSTAKEELVELLGKSMFNNPKPTLLIKYLIRLVNKKDCLVLDSFAGSGTTGHAVLDLNKDDGEKRKFILVELEDDIANKVTAERIRQAVKKFEYGEGFEFCELDKQLFNEDGQIEQECTFDQLATYIYFTETNMNIDKKAISENLIGGYNETNYYLIFKEKGKNILNKVFLKKVQKDSKNKVIYADKCLIDEDVLDKYNIQFKQIPYEIKVY